MRKNNTNKGFGILFFIVFVLIGIWPLFSSEPLRLWSVIVASLFLVLGLINSRILTPLKILWIKFGELLGKIIAPIVMSIVFFVIITPIGLFLKAIGKDVLNLKLDKKVKSYWIEKTFKSNFKKQF